MNIWPGSNYDMKAEAEMLRQLYRQVIHGNIREIPPEFSSKEEVIKLKLKQNTDGPITQASE